MDVDHVPHEELIGASRRPPMHESDVVAGDADLGAIGPEGLDCFAKVRSTRPPRPAILRAVDGEISVELVEGEAGVAPGQACVLYSAPGDEARVLGGGFIDRSERSPAAEAMLSHLLRPAA